MKDIHDLCDQSIVSRKMVRELDLSVLEPSFIKNAAPRQILWHLINKQFSIPHCGNKKCNKQVKWANPSRAYRNFCSNKCSSKDKKTLQKAQKTKINKLLKLPINELWDLKYQVTYAALAHLDFSHLNSEITESKNAQRILWHLIFAIDKTPICYHEKCLNHTNWAGRNYNKYCANKCAVTDPRKETARLQTLKNIYNVNSPIHIPKVKLKIQQTNICRYGYSQATKNEQIKQKIKKTNLERYDVEYPMQNVQVKERFKKSNIKKYGVEYPMQSDIIASKLQRVTSVHWPEQTKKIISNCNSFNQFSNNRSIAEIATLLNIDYSTAHKYAGKYNTKIIALPPRRSSQEIILCEWLSNIGISNVITNDRVILNNKEIDIYLPDFNLAIECNGIYWHSEFINKDRQYHFNKWDQCRKKHIQLITLFETDWINSQEKIKNLILSRLGQKQKGVAARKCIINKITATDVRPFLNQFHLQGFVGGIHYGAYNLNQLIGVMTFGWTRGSKQSRRFELKRWVTDNNTHPGLFSKVFNVAQKELEFKFVVSFSDNRWFTGQLYNKTGFFLDKVTKPSYYYVYKNQLWHHSNFTKERIRKKFNLMNNNRTEFQMMDDLRIPRIWDCGKLEWVWKTN